MPHAREDTMHTTTNGSPKPDPADDRPPPGDAGTPQRPPPRVATVVSPPNGTGEAAERAGRNTALLADVPRPRRHGAGDAHAEDEAKQPDTARDADAVQRDAADRGIAAAIAGVDIVPSEDR
jgi:hypothetical protein